MLKKRKIFFLKKFIKTPLIVLAYRFLSNRKTFLYEKQNFIQAFLVLNQPQLIYNFIIFLKKKKGKLLLNIFFYKIFTQTIKQFQYNFLFRRKLWKKYILGTFFFKKKFFFNIELFFFKLL